MSFVKVICYPTLLVGGVDSSGAGATGVTNGGSVGGRRASASHGGNGGRSINRSSVSRGGAKGKGHRFGSQGAARDKCTVSLSNFNRGHRVQNLTAHASGSGVVGLGAGAQQAGEQHGGQNADDGDDDQQLNGI